ncbi:MAG: T9SS type A sorting domain-containing protein [Flavobacterium sp.]|nr:MAG: T9SS type A sorting domain-containing protein [Flavobacterium sp.]
MRKLYLLAIFSYVSFAGAQTIVFPDANFKLKLLSADTSNTIAKDLGGNYFKIDANSDGEIQVSEAQNVSDLYLNGYGWSAGYITDFTGINEFANLARLDVRYQHMASFSVSGLAQLNYIDCGNVSTYITTLALNNLPALETLKCAGDDQLANVTLAGMPNLKFIYFGGCKFQANALANLTGLQELYGYGGLSSSQTSLNLANKPNLKIIDLENNQLATITFAPANVIETLNVDANDLSTFDKTLFANLKNLKINWNRLPSLDVSGMTQLEFIDCGANGSFINNTFLGSLNVQDCPVLNTIICSDNRLIHLDCSGLSSLQYLDCSGNYDVFTHLGMLDVTLHNCTSLQHFIGSGNTLVTEYDLSCSQNYAEIRVQQCSNLQRINLKNGHLDDGMYAGLFSMYSDPMLNLVGVDYGENFTFFDPSIAQSPYYDFTPFCKYNTVKGNIKFDIEGNGCQDNAGVANIKVSYPCTLPECYTFTNEQGDYTIYTQSNTISLTPQNNPFVLFDFGLSGPFPITFSSNVDLLHADFCLAPNVVHNDLEVSVLPITNCAPGFDAQYKVVYKNKGNQIQSGTVQLTFQDSLMDFVSSIPSASGLTANEWTLNFTDLYPFETREAIVRLNINSPVETPPVNIGDILHFTASLTSAGTDETPIDNTFVLNQTVVGSLDPNDKTCLEGNIVSPDMVGQYVHYIIRFENTGSANAHNIVVSDMIDTSKFDISSLMPISSSHSVYTRMVENNRVEFIFENINLPFNDANNDGYVAFKIKTKPTLVVGGTFSNNASIYFDYNFPIVTNTATTTIQTLGNPDLDFSDELVLYPNPAKNVFNLKPKNGVQVQSVSIYNLLGQLLIISTGNTEIIDVSELKTGNYLVKVKSNKGMATTKIIKE